MKMLALELSSPIGSIAFCDTGRTSSLGNFRPTARIPAFFSKISKAISGANAGCRTSIVVGLGPGSYAGVRIAIATALGLRAAASARLVGLAVDLRDR